MPRPTVSNALLIIRPCWHHGTWVFDDPARGLVQEPFVAGVPEMITHLARDVPNARGGFRLTFSATPFPGHQATFHRVRAESGGTWYRSDGPPAEGWLCPALFKYFDEAPERLYARADAIGE